MLESHGGTCDCPYMPQVPSSPPSAAASSARGRAAELLPHVRMSGIARGRRHQEAFGGAQEWRASRLYVDWVWTTGGRSCFVGLGGGSSSSSGFMLCCRCCFLHRAPGKPGNSTHRLTSSRACDICKEGPARVHKGAQ